MKDRNFFSAVVSPPPHKPLTKRFARAITTAMSRPDFTFQNPTPLVVGSFGDADSLAAATPETLAEQCDIAEIRLDLLHAEFSTQGNGLWRHLLPFPLLFTARCQSEGSPFDLDQNLRKNLLRAALPDAAVIDIEVRNIAAMEALISEICSRGVPWIASYHDFEKLPCREELAAQARNAKQAGASAFKAAARLITMDDLTALAHFQISEQGIPLSTMGMGVLAPVSRLLCAQAGSVLNYGFVGNKTTAPGQWSARQLRDCIRSLTPLS